MQFVRANGKDSFRWMLITWGKIVNFRRNWQYSQSDVIANVLITGFCTKLHLFSVHFIEILNLSRQLSHMWRNCEYSALRVYLFGVFHFSHFDIVHPIPSEAHTNKTPNNVQHSENDWDSANVRRIKSNNRNCFHTMCIRARSLSAKPKSLPKSCFSHGRILIGHITAVKSSRCGAL